MPGIVVSCAQAHWRRICDAGDRQVQVFPNAYLKLWALTKPTLCHGKQQLPFQLILLDEAQDVNEVTLQVRAG